MRIPRKGDGNNGCRRCALDVGLLTVRARHSPGRQVADKVRSQVTGLLVGSGEGTERLAEQRS